MELIRDLSQGSLLMAPGHVGGGGGVDKVGNLPKSSSWTGLNGLMLMMGGGVEEKQRASGHQVTVDTAEVGMWHSEEKGRGLTWSSLRFWTEGEVRAGGGGGAGVQNS